MDTLGIADEKRKLFFFFSRVAFIFLGNLFYLSVDAQQIYPGDSFDVKAIIGSHAIGDKGAFLQDRLYGLDVIYNKNILNNQDQWVKSSHVQSYGLGLVIRDLSNLKGHLDTSAHSFGHAVGLVGQMDLLIYKRGNTSLNLTPAMGLSYLNKTFFTDTKNRFIGSHLNVTIKADISVQTPMTQNVYLTAGLGFLHYSNGGFYIPNSGLNTLSFSTGLLYKRPSKIKETNKSNFSQLQRNTFEVNLGIGRRGVFEGKNGLLKSGLSAGYNVYVNDIFMLKSGFDAVYYYTPFDPSPGKDIQTFQYYGTSYDRWRTGVSIGAETTLWRLALNLQMGRYIHYNSYYPNIKWYWTNSLIYYINPHVGLQAKTYMHTSQADYINFGLMFRL